MPTILSIIKPILQRKEMSESLVSLVSIMIEHLRELLKLSFCVSSQVIIFTTACNRCCGRRFVDYRNAVALHKGQLPSFEVNEHQCEKRSLLDQELPHVEISFDVHPRAFHHSTIAFWLGERSTAEYVYSWKALFLYLCPPKKVSLHLLWQRGFIDVFCVNVFELSFPFYKHKLRAVLCLKKACQEEPLQSESWERGDQVVADRR